MTTARVFFSYSSADELARRELDKHLAVMRRARLLETWSFREIEAGDDWRTAIDTQLNEAEIILFLVSPDFLNSDYCWDIEMKRALERDRRGEARVVPVIVRDCDWQAAPFAKLQALPADGKPVTRWRHRDTAWTNVATSLRKALERTHKRQSRRKRQDEVTIIAPTQLHKRYNTSGSGADARNRLAESWRLAILDEAEPRLFAFKASNGFDGVCEVERHVLKNDHELFVISDIADNPGQSTTNSIEYIVKQLLNRFNRTLVNTTFIEHFALASGEVEWNLVMFDQPAAADSAGAPRWRRLEFSDWQQLGLTPRFRRRERTRSSLLVKHRPKRKSRLTLV